MKSTIHPRYRHTLEQEKWVIVSMNADTGEWEYVESGYDVESLDEGCRQAYEVACVVPEHVAKMILGI